MATNQVGKTGAIIEKSLDKQLPKEAENLAKEANIEDVDHFKDLLKDSNAIKAEQATNIQGQSITRGSTNDTIGDKILNSFQKVKSNIDTKHHEINNRLNSSEVLSMQQMFQTQRAIANLTITEDLIAKIVGKTTQNIDTLMKQQ